MLHQGWSTTTTKKDFKKCFRTKFNIFDQGSVLKKGYKKAGFIRGVCWRKKLKNAEPSLINIWPEDVLKKNAKPSLINNNSRGTKTVWTILQTVICWRHKTFCRSSFWRIPQEISPTDIKALFNFWEASNCYLRYYLSSLDDHWMKVSTNMDDEHQHDNEDHWSSSSS